MIADLGDTAAGLCVIDTQGQSGHVGSAHFIDQLDDWTEGKYHYLPLDGVQAAREELV